MEQDFYKGRLQDIYGLEILIPGSARREQVNRIIFDELVLGKLEDESREIYHQVIGDLIDMGAQGIILGCTEIPLLVDPYDFDVPIFDTTNIHAGMAVEIALGERRLDTSMIID
jgi:aspartate racemase